MRDWGDGGEQFGWWCTDDPDAFVGSQPLSVSAKDEIFVQIALKNRLVTAGQVEEAKQIQQQIEELTEQIRQVFGDPFEIAENPLKVTASVGIATNEIPIHDQCDLLRNADIAMYAAKNAGKRMIRHFTSEMQDYVDVRHRVQSKLRDALSDGEIDLYFQPKVAAVTREIVGCEALVRWRTPLIRHS